MVVLTDSVTLAPAAYCMPLALPSAHLLKVYPDLVNPLADNVKEGLGIVV